MDDAFATLGIQRSAAIDGEALDRIYHEISKSTHPDVSGGAGDQFEAVNAAYGLLKTDSKRLKHFRELEFPEVEAERSAAMDPDLMDLFAKLGPAMQKAEVVVKELAEAKSALSKALLADAIWETRDALEEQGVEVSERLGQLAGECGEIDAKFANDERDEALALLDRSYRTAAFLEKWQGQIREKLMGLMG